MSANQDFTQYQSPQINPIRTGMTGKHCTSPAFTQKIRTNIDNIEISELVREFGSPLFVFSEKILRERYQKTLTVFQNRYPNVKFAWSYKTNYLKSICALFHQMGSLAEVVSGMEYEKARQLGVPGNQIIFNGPMKSNSDLERAVKEGAMIHLDGFDELLDLEEVAVKLHQEVPVGIRVNLDAGMPETWSRFGFNYENGEAADAIRRIQAGGKLRVTGLHTHIGTFILDPKAYCRAATKLAKLSTLVEEIQHSAIEYIDLGGGLPSRNHLKGIYQPPEIAVPPIEQYADELSTALLRAFSGRILPQLYLESGRHLVDEAGYLITSVHAARNLPDGRRGYVLDAGINLLYTGNWYRHKLEFNKAGSGAFEPAVLYGPLCMNIDVMADNLMLPRLLRNSHVIFSPVGAYNITQSMQFIHCRPAIVMVRMDGSVDLIKHSETMMDIENGEVLPADLSINQPQQKLEVVA
jgi:diaminopimelate decarboxylase